MRNWESQEKLWGSEDHFITPGFCRLQAHVVPRKRTRLLSPCLGKMDVIEKLRKAQRQHWPFRFFSYKQRSIWGIWVAKGPRQVFQRLPRVERHGHTVAYQKTKKQIYAWIRTYNIVWSEFYHWWLLTPVGTCRVWASSRWLASCHFQEYWEGHTIILASAAFCLTS